MTGSRIYSVAIVRELDLDALAVLSDEEADAGEDDGLQGNQQYRDMRGASWDQVADALAQEAALFQRFAASAGLNEEAELYEHEREDAFLPEEDLWGLDIGVIGATLALSALGATTVSSCNAGGFGGHHTAIFPHVAFFLPREAAPEVMAIAEAAEVGLDVVEGGIARLYGRTDHDLHRFAEVALQRDRGAR
ncbi:MULTISPECIES: hypothetical protein [Phenylobacterium]|jgi:hypothetical protein|uniref:Uncharacterized protein n=1 Tax=Phenylobacterium haematophilum TaxID=98513 RepID=A0A840A633_9CAUL|nr:MULTISPECIES: hypothetical protein [Phenylobacterium]MBB3893020.1 hypothetical protein [Phenylobacterium haematophilum]